MGTTMGQRLVVIWLVLSGLSAVFYADLVSLPPVSESPVPQAWWIVGATTLVAAVGVLRRAEWGRLLAMVVVTFSAFWAVWVEAYWIWLRDVDLSAWLRDWHWLNIVVTGTISGLALWWLLRRWPSSRHEAV